jgi:hypothetical protein
MVEVPPSVVLSTTRFGISPLIAFGSFGSGQKGKLVVLTLGGAVTGADGGLEVGAIGATGEVP